MGFDIFSAATQEVVSSGTGADESVHSLIDAVYSKLPYREFQRRVRIHPTVSELLPTAMESLKPLG